MAAIKRTRTTGPMSAMTGLDRLEVDSFAETSMRVIAHAPMKTARAMARTRARDDHAGSVTFAGIVSTLSVRALTNAATVRAGPAREGTAARDSTGRLAAFRLPHPTLAHPTRAPGNATVHAQRNMKWEPHLTSSSAANCCALAHCSQCLRFLTLGSRCPTLQILARTLRSCISRTSRSSSSTSSAP